MWNNIKIFINLFKLYRFSFYIINFRILEFDNNKNMQELYNNSMMSDTIYMPIILQVFFYQLLIILVLLFNIVTYIISMGKKSIDIEDSDSISILIVNKNNKIYKHLKSNDPEVVKISNEILFNKSFKIL